MLTASSPRRCYTVYYCPSACLPDHQLEAADCRLDAVFASLPVPRHFDRHPMTRSPRLELRSRKEAVFERLCPILCAGRARFLGTCIAVDLPRWKRPSPRAPRAMSRPCFVNGLWMSAAVQRPPVAMCFCIWPLDRGRGADVPDDQTPRADGRTHDAEPICQNRRPNRHAIAEIWAGHEIKKTAGGRSRVPRNLLSIEPAAPRMLELTESDRRESRRIVKPAGAG